MPTAALAGMTRIAPTPSGYLHIGNLLNAHITSQLAASKGISVLLRIDDLDRARVRPAYIENIFQSLERAGIFPDCGPSSLEDFERNWSQALRLPLYQHYIEQLIASQSAYLCSCSRSQLALSSGLCTCSQHLAPPPPDAPLRLQSSKDRLAFLDWNSRKIDCVLPDALSNFIIRRRDGIPAYQLSSLADDLHFGITHIVRGEDLLGSTCAQIELARKIGALASNFLNTCFFHHPLIPAQNGEKLSKSQQAPAATEQYASRQKLRDALQRLAEPILENLL